MCLQVGSILRYICNSGYALKGDEVRRCLEDLSLSGREPFCERITCPQPEPLENGLLILSDTTLVMGTTARYRCNEGYLLQGEESRTCNNNSQFSGSTPSCNIVECPSQPDVIANGQVTGSSFTFGSIISYACNEGYRLEGVDRRACRADGSWDQPIPSCLIVECPPVRIAFGSASTSQRTFGTNVTFSCQDGYKVRGLRELTCMASGRWSGSFPTCTKITCPLPRLLENGRFRLVNDTYLRYQCNNGYRLEGSEEAFCSLEEQWEPDLPVCRIVTCEDLSSAVLPYGRVIFTSANFGTTVRYTCEPGYQLIGVSSRRCSASGEWEGEQPICQPVSCLSPGTLLNGAISGTNFSYKAEVTYECKEGYNIVGPATRTCQENRLWTGTTPRCEIVVCPNLEKIDDGVVAVVSNIFGGTVRYSCLSGFFLRGNIERTCLATGQWSGTTPDCVRSVCPAPAAIENGFILGADYGIGRTIQFFCNEGYRTLGVTVSTCLPNLMWSSGTPSCERVLCPELGPVLYGRIVGDGRRFEDKVHYECEEGYEVMGDDMRQCQADGTWSGDNPECSAVSCGLPPILANAIPDLSNGTMFPALIRYACDLGYVARGNPQSACLSNATWSFLNFMCELASCSDVPDEALPNGIIERSISSHSVKKVFTFNDVIRFSCHEGFRLEGSNSATCQADGTWSSSTPRCVAITCSEPSAIANGSLLVKGYDYGSTAVYECHTGYRVTGDGVLVCSGDGQWSGNSACELVTCNAPALTIPNGRLLLPRVSYDYKDQAVYECDVGYETVGASVLTCGADGSFASLPPTCAKIKCPPPDPPTNGNLQVEEDVLVYSCLPGYQLQGQARRSCLPTGVWDGQAAVCIAKTCPTPGPISDGYMDGKETTYGSDINYFCNDGFRLVGTARLSCLATAMWSAEFPTCEKVSCGPARPVEYGTVVGTSFLYQDVVTYQCEQGFSLTGHRVRTCLANSSWSGEDPVCKEILCPDPPDIEHSENDASDDENANFGLDVVVEYTCDEGYQLTGSTSSITCQENGTWSQPFPVCVPVSCPALTGPDNGHVTGDDIIFGSKLIFSCNRGYRLDGSETLTCAADASWDQQPPTCRQIVCASPEIPNGSARIPESSENTLAPLTFLPGQTVVFTCLLGFRLKGSTESTCTEDGVWSNLPPACERVACAAPPRVDNSLPMSDIVSFAGTSITYACQAGYDLQGEATIACGNDGEWEGVAPTCVDMTCGWPPNVLNAVVDRSEPETAAGQFVTYTCEQGFSMADEHNGVVPCLRGGEWGQDLPRCEHVDCGPPPVPFFASVTVKGTTAGSTAHVACNPGYLHPDGQKVLDVVCDISGRWAGSEGAVCIPRDCGPVPTVENSAPFGNVNTTFGQQVTYQCRSGYVLSGNPTLRCGSNGQWEGALPACNVISCGSPPTSLRFTGTNFTLGGVVILTCPSGSQINGPSKLTCGQDGSWSPEPGTCQGEKTANSN